MASLRLLTSDYVTLGPFADSDIARYSHEGKLAWVTRYMALFGDPRMAWGCGISPIVLEDSVLLPWNHHSGRDTLRVPSITRAPAPSETSRRYPV